MELCPCQSSKTYVECCLPYIEGTQPVPTAQALMRARYTAHAKGFYDYLESTVHPDLRNEEERQQMEGWSKEVEWHSLEILATRDGGVDDTTGEVSFDAQYTVHGMPQHLREDAFFRKEDGTWFYVDGNVHGDKPVRRAGPKIGRNDPCSCGSGKKYKKCCA